MIDAAGTEQYRSNCQHVTLNSEVAVEHPIKIFIPDHLNANLSWNGILSGIAFFLF
jgi:hypothetical protein